MNIIPQTDPWLIIQNNEFEKAINLIDVQFETTRRYSLLRNKILALFHLKKYVEVISLSEKLIEYEKGESQFDFISLGVANWILGNTFKAIEAWQQSKKSSYKDAAGGLETEVYLYFAGIKTHNIKLTFDAKRAIKKLLKLKKSTNWPGPLGHYLLNEITDKELFSNIVTVHILKERQLCQAHFVFAIKRLETGDTDGYYKKLRDCISYGSPSYLEQMYYLAKGELETIETPS